MDVRPLERWNSRSFTVLLAALDQYGFDVKKDTGTIVYETTINNPMREEIIESIKEQTSPSSAPSQIIIPNIVMPSAPNTPSAPQSPPQNPEADMPRKGRGSLLLPIGPMRLDLMTLRELIYKVDEHIYFNSPVTEDELRGMEATIAKLRSKYGGIFSPY
jgi:hypothetical protein